MAKTYSGRRSRVPTKKKRPDLFSFMWRVRSHCLTPFGPLDGQFLLLLCRNCNNGLRGTGGNLWPTARILSLFTFWNLAPCKKKLAPLSFWEKKKVKENGDMHVCVVHCTWLSGWVQFMAVENSCQFVKVLHLSTGVSRRRHAKRKKKRKKKANAPAWLREREKRRIEQETDPCRERAWFHSALSLTSFLFEQKNKTCTAISVCVFPFFDFQVTPGVVSSSLSLSRGAQHSLPAGMPTSSHTFSICWPLSIDNRIVPAIVCFCLNSTLYTSIDN